MTHSDHRQYDPPSENRNLQDASSKKPLAKGMPPVSWTDRFEGREEPALREMIEDPIMICLLTSDGLTANSVLDVVNKMKEKKKDHATESQDL